MATKTMKKGVDYEQVNTQKDFGVNKEKFKAIAKEIMQIASDSGDEKGYAEGLLKNMDENEPDEKLARLFIGMKVFMQVYGLPNILTMLEK